MMRYILFLLCFVFYLTGAEEGNPCVKGGVLGICVNIRNCKSAIDDIKKRINPQICSFQGADPVVCCTDQLQSTTVKTPVATTTSQRPVSTTEVIPTYDYVNNDGGGAVEACEPIDPSLTSPRTGQKAWDMCLEYQQKYVYPCDKGVNLGGGVSRGTHCHHNADDLILGGENANENEFTHMVLLGYGQRVENVQWQCGGSLISDRFVLTAGHCTVSRDGGPVSFALMGALKRTDTIDSSKLRSVKRFINGPGYNPPHRYHDIALVELDTPVNLNQFLVPACLHVANDSVNDERASATGWGLTADRGNVADHLQKVILTKFTVDECSEKFPSNRLLKQGFDRATQICYGDKQLVKDTCQGDSGGPLQIKSKPIHCMYMVIGVTSFGKKCGVAGDPGIYTRVSQYVPWIESQVWP